MRGNRKKLVMSSSIVAIFLALASMAYACVIFKGDMQILSPSGNGNKVTGDGAAHGYCPGGGATTAAKGRTGDAITVEVGRASQCNVVPDNHLGSGLKQIRLRNTNAYVGLDGTQWSMIQGMGCWAGSPPPSTFVKNIRLHKGTGSENFTLGSVTANAAGTASNLCVGDGISGTGIMAPLVIL